MTRKRTTEKDLIATPAAAPARRKAPAKPRARRTAASPEAAPAPAAEAVATPSAMMAEPAASVTVLEPTYEEIANLAYSYWQARGCQGGSSDEDWLRAEQELRIRAVAAVA
jgi:hypothetical protein